MIADAGVQFVLIGLMPCVWKLRISRSCTRANLRNNIPSLKYNLQKVFFVVKFNIICFFVKDGVVYQESPEVEAFK